MAQTSSYSGPGHKILSVESGEYNHLYVLPQQAELVKPNYHMHISLLLMPVYIGESICGATTTKSHDLFVNPGATEWRTWWLA